MSKEYIVDRVIGVKVCHKCGYPISVEGYDIPGSKRILDTYTVCAHLDGNRQYCNGIHFTDPKFEVKMKPYKEWLNPLLRRMNK